MIRILSLAIVIAYLGSVTQAQEWTSVRSPHFVVSTDAGEKRCREVALRFEEMRFVFERLLSNDKLTSPVPLQILAFRNAKGLQELLIDAWNHLKAATTLSPELAEAHSELAYALSDLGDKEGAIKEATTAARLNQGHERYYLNLAELYFEFKKYQQAKTMFEQLTSSDDPKTASLARQRLETLKTLDGAHDSAAPKR